MKIHCSDILYFKMYLPLVFLKLTLSKKGQLDEFNMAITFLLNCLTESPDAEDTTSPRYFLDTLNVTVIVIFAFLLNG